MSSKGWEIRWSNSRDRVSPRPLQLTLTPLADVVGLENDGRYLTMFSSFYNAEKAESRWEAPEGLSSDEIRALPGHELLERAASGAGASSGGEPKRIQASHLLIKHNESRRPASWRSVRLDLAEVWLTLDRRTRSRGRRARRRRSSPATSARSVPPATFRPSLPKSPRPSRTARRTRTAATSVHSSAAKCRSRASAARRPRR